MGRYLPGAILAVCGVLVYAIGGLVLLAHRRQRRRGQAASKSLFVYAIVMMIMGIASLGVGLLALEAAQYHALSQ
jgi:uncharacterized membrane protein YidH (DUF202 family)